MSERRFLGGCAVIPSARGAARGSITRKGNVRFMPRSLVLPSSGLVSPRTSHGCSQPHKYINCSQKPAGTQSKVLPVWWHHGCVPGSVLSCSLQPGSCPGIGASRDADVQPHSYLLLLLRGEAARADPSAWSWPKWCREISCSGRWSGALLLTLNI